MDGMMRFFPFQPIRILLFFFTVPSSLLLCFLFFFWVLRNSPSGDREAHLQFSSVLQSIAYDDRLLPLRSNNSVRFPSSFVLEGIVFGEETSGSVRKVFGSIHEAKGRNSSETRCIGDTGSSSSDLSDQALVGKCATFGDAHLKKEANLVVAPSRITTVPSEEDACKTNNVTLRNSCSRSSQALAGKIEKERWSACDVSRGSWVFDETYPLYSDVSCPFIDEGFSCQANGRRDADYMKWRWQPDDCTYPRFSAVKLLEMIRGKRLVFVGDSLNRNQWESMLCLLRNGVKDPSRMCEAHRRTITKEKGNYNFKFTDYNCSVEYYVTHFLVHESKARIGGKRRPTLRIDAIDRSSSKWRGADILVFNTAHWWSHYKTKAGKNYYQEGDQVHSQLDVATAFRRALATWASWIDHNVDPRKTQVFFRSSAPSHFRGGEWNSGGHCKESTRPLNDTTLGTPDEKNTILEQTIKQMKTPVTLLSITNMSGLRIDGHPSVYGTNPRRGPLKNVQDCSHWCLPGVPDAWNEILYFHLLSKQKPVSPS